jgi:hypothetical protein
VFRVPLHCRGPSYNFRVILSLTDCDVCPSCSSSPMVLSLTLKRVNSSSVLRNGVNVFWLTFPVKKVRFIHYGTNAVVCGKGGACAHVDE